MKKIVIIVLLALTAIPSFSQENVLKFGARTGFNLYNVFWNGKPPSIGTGFGGGLATVLPITSSLAFNPELNFYYRNVYNHKLKDERGEMEEGMSEFAFALDIRGAVDLTNISKEKNDRDPNHPPPIGPPTGPPPVPINPFKRDKIWLIQYGLGISYFL